MKPLTIRLLGSVSTLFGVAGVHAADLPARKAAPIEFVRVCNAYGTGFFYIPGTDTCLRLSGRARFEYGYQTPLARTGTAGDYSGYRGLARINLDARTNTGYGTLRVFVRLELASRTGTPTVTSGTQARFGNSFFATGQDTAGRVQQYVSTDKAFVQFAGFTAGRASSFFDFYAHDFEIQGTSFGSDVGSTNLAAYTATLGNGFSTTLSMEDPSFRRSPVYASQTATFQSPLITSLSIAGVPTAFVLQDVVQRNRMPDFVGTLRVDQAWGSAQLSAAVHEVNVGTVDPAQIGPSFNLSRPPSEYGWAVQGGVKVNLPFIAAGDTLYLQGAYGQGAQFYTGYSFWAGSAIQTASGLQGAPFAQYFSEATLNPLTGKLQLSTSYTVVASLLHYWNPSLRSALYGSWGGLEFTPGARASQAAYFGLTGTGPGALNSTYYNLNSVLRDTYGYNVGASLIWSPVKDLDIGIEGQYQNYSVQNGRVLDVNKNPLQSSAAYVNNPANIAALRTVTSADAFHVRARVQRDF